MPKKIKIDTRILFIFVTLSVAVSFIFVDPLASYVLFAIASIKSKLFLFLKTSAKKLLLYVQTLTLAKAVGVGIKRFIIDNYISKWIGENVVEPVKKPIVGYIRFFFALNLKEKIKRILYVIVPASIILYVGSVTNVLSHVVFYAEIKAFVIAFFKFLWIVGDKVFAWVYNLFVVSWLSPILQIFALAWIMEKLEKIPVIGKPLKTVFGFFDNFFSSVFGKLEFYWNKYVESHINEKTKEKMRKISLSLQSHLEKLKHRNEIWVMKNFIGKYTSKMSAKEYFNSELNEFLSRKKVEKIGKEDKIEFYLFHNKKTKDNVDIVAFFDIGEIPPLRDVLIIESFATKNSDGNESSNLSKNSFWVLNMNDNSVLLVFDDEQKKEVLVKPGKIKLVHSMKQDFSKMKIIINGKEEEIPVIEIPANKKENKNNSIEKELKHA